MGRGTGRRQNCSRQTPAADARRGINEIIPPLACSPAAPSIVSCRRSAIRWNTHLMNVFVLCTGRCGSVTFVEACKHVTNYTSAHESRAGIAGPGRVQYPPITSRQTTGSPGSSDGWRKPTEMMRLRAPDPGQNADCRASPSDSQTGLIINAYARGTARRPKAIRWTCASTTSTRSRRISRHFSSPRPGR